MKIWQHRVKPTSRAVVTADSISQGSKSFAWLSAKAMHRDLKDMLGVQQRATAFSSSTASLKEGGRLDS